jgi:hypothetical protein
VESSLPILTGNTPHNVANNDVQGDGSHDEVTIHLLDPS